MATADFRRQLEGFGLTTANILYRMPDHPGILQNFIWQHHDLHPHFPELKKFLDFWTRELDGLLHSVTVAHSRLDQAGGIQGGRRGIPAALSVQARTDAPSGSCAQSRSLLRALAIAS